MTNKEYGLRIVAVREHHKMKQTKFGPEIGMSQSNLSKIELGKAQPSKTVAYALMARFGIDPEWVLTGKGEMFLSPQAYLANGIKLWGAPKIGEGFVQLLEDPEYAELPSLIAAEKMVKGKLDHDLETYLRYILNTWHQGDEKLRNWLKVQLERAFPEAGKEEKG